MFLGGAYRLEEESAGTVDRPVVVPGSPMWAV